MTEGGEGIGARDSVFNEVIGDRCTTVVGDVPGEGDLGVARVADYIGGGCWYGARCNRNGRGRQAVAGRVHGNKGDVVLCAINKASDGKG